MKLSDASGLGEKAMLDRELAMADRGTCRTRRPVGARLRGALVALCGVMALGACGSNQSGVRDWSLQAREAVLPPALARPTPDGAPIDRAAEEMALLLREVAGAWLATLAALADNATPPDDSAPIEQRALALPDPEASAAAVNLVRATAFVSQRGWGSSHLAYAVDHGDPFFQAVLAAIARHGSAARGATMARVGAGHALLFERRFILGQSDTGRMMRMEASELRRLSAVATAAP
ncbi:MAG: hypothetical protein O9325_06280 [Roseomonas sp.]|nr:hypothetical protein [Roseomonas sp.]